jgi:hypothetical protein
MLSLDINANPSSQFGRILPAFLDFATGAIPAQMSRLHDNAVILRQILFSLDWL